jgi:hypothetical protein
MAIAEALDTNHQEERLVGANWFFRGHRMKISADVGQPRDRGVRACVIRAAHRRFSRCHACERVYPSAQILQIALRRTETPCKDRLARHRRAHVQWEAR